MLGQGWSLNGDDKCITLISPCKSSTIMFDIVIKTPNGCIFATMLTRSHEITATNVQENKEPKLKPKIPTMTLMDAHRKLGHCDVEKAKRTAKAMGWRLTSSTMDPCAACAMGEAKQKNVPKKSTRIKATKPGERLYHDISTITGNSDLGCPKSQWHVSMDEYSQFAKSKFYKKKNRFIEDFCKYIKSLENRQLHVQYIRMDNSGENKKFLERAKDSEWQLGFEAEFTARNTPQQNGLVEVKIATIAGRARAMCNAANMDNDTRHYVANEALSHSTDLLIT